MTDHNRIKEGSRLLAKGVRVSNNTRKTLLNNNDCIIGSSGCGKTGGYVLPLLQDAEGSLVVTDTKRRLVHLVRDDLIARGYRVEVIDFVEPEHSTLGYNPLRQIRRRKDGSVNEQDAFSIANALQPVKNSKDMFWDQAARRYLLFLILCLTTCMEECDQTIPNMLRLHEIVTIDESLSFFEDLAKSAPDSHFAQLIPGIQSIRSVDRTWSCIAEQAEGVLSAFEAPELSAILSAEHCIEPEILGRQKTVLFLNISDLDSAMDTLVNLCFTQTLQALFREADGRADGALPVPVRLVMDDFAAGARIGDFDRIISVIRSRNISVSLILQSITQLESRYTKAEAATILNNCDHVLYLGSQDISTADFIASHASRTREAVLTMPRDMMYLLTSGEKARLLERVKPYSTLETREKGAERE